MVGRKTIFNTTIKYCHFTKIKKIVTIKTIHPIFIWFNDFFLISNQSFFLRVYLKNNLL
ncbi:MAG: hypothetical protein RLZZ248_2108 [Bacteroidota bacterium]